jgi:hypothetical protein
MYGRLNKFDNHLADTERVVGNIVREKGFGPSVQLGTAPDTLEHFRRQKVLRLQTIFDMGRYHY